MTSNLRGTGRDPRTLSCAELTEWITDNLPTNARDALRFGGWRGAASGSYRFRINLGTFLLRQHPRDRRHGDCRPQEVPMMSLRLAAALAAVGLFTSGVVFAEGAKPNDAQIAHIAYTAGQLDIEAAELAKKKSKNKDVLAFAADMERDHKAVNEKALALVKKLGVSPEDNDTSKALSKQAADKRAELAKLSGKDFDKAYIDNEVAYHKTVNSALQSTLIPDASNGELKDLLTTGLKIFQGHEQHAEHVAAEFK
jgi:putative membrane protein